MIIINAIISWIVSKILDIFFSKKNQELIEIYERRIREQSESIEKLGEERGKREKERQRIIQSLKRSGLSVDKLIERYDKPLNAILLSCFFQRVPDGTSFGVRQKFVPDELEAYDSKYLGGGVYLIPPARVPLWIHNRNDLKTWFEKEILKGRYCKLKFLVLVDIGKKAFWKSYLTYEQTRAAHFTPGELLRVEELFTEEQIRRISISHIIRDGDIGWLSYQLLSSSEFDIIHKNQAAIERELGNPSLRELSDTNMVGKITRVLDKYGIINPAEISKAIVSEARFWNSELR